VRTAVYLCITTIGEVAGKPPSTYQNDAGGVAAVNPDFNHLEAITHAIASFTAIQE
jgi:hypothetical protein